MGSTGVSAALREARELRSIVAPIEAATIVFRAWSVGEEAPEYLNPDGSAYEGDPADVHLVDVVAKAIRPLLANPRHAVLHGGRAGSKSHTVARYLVAVAYTYSVRVLCVREVQLSMRDSVHSLLREVIDSDPVFRAHFEVLESEIRAVNGSLFVFKGMRRESAHSVKGFESFDLAWVEEADALSRRSIDLLIPTIRKAGSRFVWSLNPDDADDPAYRDFIVIERDDAIIEQVLYTDNPYASAETIRDAERDKQNDPAKYRHVWMGGLRERGRGMIFPDFRVIPDIDLAEIPFKTPKERERYGSLRSSRFERQYGKGSVFCGLDWSHGGSNPTHLVFGWLAPKANRVIVIAEYRAEGAKLNQIGAAIPRDLPLIKDRYIPIWCDSAVPMLADHLRAFGLNAKAVPKWPNSVLQGIERLRSASIEICERCEHTIKNFSLYSWELDANEEPTGTPEKRHDHAPDSLRYGVWRWLKAGPGASYQQLSDPFFG